MACNGTVSISLTGPLAHGGCSVGTWEGTNSVLHHLGYLLDGSCLFIFLCSDLYLCPGISVGMKPFCPSCPQIGTVQRAQGAIYFVNFPFWFKVFRCAYVELHSPVSGSVVSEAAPVLVAGDAEGAAFGSLQACPDSSGESSCWNTCPFLILFLSPVPLPREPLRLVGMTPRLIWGAHPTG